MKIMLAPILLAGLVLLVPYQSNNIDKKTGFLNDRSKVVYHVNENKLKEGGYSILSPSEVTLLRGVYKGDKRTGNWYAFNSDGKMFLRYNYEANKLLFIDTDLLKDKVDIRVLDKDKDVVDNASIPVPIASFDLLTSLLSEELKYTLSKGVPEDIEAEITAHIDSEGGAEYTATYKYNRKQTQVGVTLREKLFEIEWLPSIYKGKSYPSEFKFITKFSTMASGHKRSNWN